MIEVRAIEMREIALMLREPFRISSGVETRRRILLLRLIDSSGHSVWSECVAGSAPNYSPETVDTCWLMIRDFVAPEIVGTRLTSAREAAPLLAARIRGNRMAIAAVEMGLWGLESLVRGEPLAVMLGGTRERVATGISLGIQDSPEALVERARQAVAEGYRKVKLKIRPGADVEFVAAVREAIGDAPLMADANNAYTLAQAEVLKKLDSLGLMMIEQPLAWDDIRHHAELQRFLETPICLDESITSAERAREMIDLDAGRVVNIKPGRVGGLRESLAIHDTCSEADIPVWCGGMLESGIGRAYNVALASLPNFSIPGDNSPSARYWERDVVQPEWVMDSDGLVQVPRSRPGPGVEVDEDFIGQLTVRQEILEH